MAAIYKRRNKYSVVYSYIDEHGIERKKWETYATNAEAKKRKTEIEFQKQTNTFISPNCKTVKDLLHDYVNLYGISKWAHSSYARNQSLITNYINPYIGDKPLDKCTTKFMEAYYLSLLSKPAAPHSNYHTLMKITPQTVHQIHKLLRSVFKQAIKWDLLLRNPVEHATLPHHEMKIRDIWDTSTLTTALEVCDDERLSLCIHLAFACSLRIGEVLGLTWDCVDISDESIKNGIPSIYVNKELQRIQRASYDALDGKDVLFKFPSYRPVGSTVLVLKTPKTKSSVRRVYLPLKLVELLKEHKANQDNIQDLLGDEYYKYNLVITSSDGRPVEGQVINKAFRSLIQNHNLPKVVFHSLRHTSVTYKLKLNGGDIKSVQGDTGHSQVNMVTDVYSHIMDEDRSANASKLQKHFYENNNKSKATTEASITAPPSASQDPKVAQLMNLLAQSPELADILLKGLRPQ